MSERNLEKSHSTSHWAIHHHPHLSQVKGGTHAKFRAPILGQLGKMGTMGTTGHLNQQSCKLMENQPGIMGLKFYFWLVMFIHVQPAASEESTGDRWMLTLNNSASTAFILLLFHPSINLNIVFQLIIVDYHSVLYC